MIPKNNFSQQVLHIVSTIQKGKTISYKQVAAKAGNQNAARAVGNIMKKNNNPNIPCHRVIKSNGEIGGYNKGIKKKKQLLAVEGIHIQKTASQERSTKNHKKTANTS